MRIAITDDINEEREYIRTLIYDAFTKNGLPITYVSEFSSGEALLAEFKSGKFDFILLDMFMNGLGGYETARKIRQLDKDVKLIFCTTSNDFASESYEVGACYYLRKPVTAESFGKMLTQINLAKYEACRYITLPDGQKLILRHICFTEYINHMILIHLKDGSVIKTRITQKTLEELFAQFNYLYSCNKGIVVNFYEVKDIENTLFIMKYGPTVPISRRKLYDTENAYADFRFERTRKEVL